MKKIIWIIVILVILIIAAGGWWFNQQPDTPAPSDEPIKIGAILSLTGPAAVYGEMAKKGIDLAVEELNKNSGIKGRKIEVIIEDDHTDGKGAVSAFQKLVNVDKVGGLIGGLWDFVAQPIIPLALSSRITFISPSNFRIEKGFELNDQSFVMLTEFNKVIRALTSIITEESVKKLAVVHLKSSFGQEIADTLNKIMTENDKTPIIDESYAQIGGNDFKTTILKLKQAGADTVFLDMLDIDGVQFLQRAREFGFKPKVISYTLLVDALAKPDIDKSLFDGITILNWEVSSSAFVDLFENKYGTKPIKSADKAYNAVYVLAEAIANNADKSAVADYLASHSFETSNGTIVFNDTHAVENIPIKIQVIKDGKLVDLIAEK